MSERDARVAPASPPHHADRAGSTLPRDPAAAQPVPASMAAAPAADELYVYYRVAGARAGALRAAFEHLQQLQQGHDPAASGSVLSRPHPAPRLMRRHRPPVRAAGPSATTGERPLDPAATDTWMEIWPAALGRFGSLAAAIEVLDAWAEASGLAALIEGERHYECFERD